MPDEPVIDNQTANQDRKSYEILESLPVYGPMYVPVSEKVEGYYSEGFVVRFYRSDGTDWVANFKPGWTKLKEVHEFNNSSDLLVIAFGTCYIMNPELAKPVSVFGAGYSNTFKNTDGRLILQDQSELTIIEPTGEYWDSERISWDGLKDLKLVNNSVKGFAYDPIYDADEWIEFSYDLDKRVLTGGSYKRHPLKRESCWHRLTRTIKRNKLFQSVLVLLLLV